MHTAACAKERDRYTPIHMTKEKSFEDPSKTQPDVHRMSDSPEKTQELGPEELNPTLTEGFRDALDGRLFYDTSGMHGTLFKFVGIFKEPDGTHMIKLEQVGAPGSYLRINERDFIFGKDIEKGYASERWELVRPREFGKAPGEAA